MTGDEIRSLIGGYATGSLSEAERKALFEAALDDQELFDELAREQALKELLDQPGTKQRLIAALTPQPKPWWGAANWNKPWVWAAACAGVVAVISGIVLMRPAPVQQIARVELPSPPPVTPGAAPITAPAAPPPVPAQAAPEPVAPAIQAPAAFAAPPPPPPPMAPPATSAASLAPPAQSPVAPVPVTPRTFAPVTPGAQAFVTPAAPAPVVPPPAPIPAPSRSTAETVTVTAEASLLKTDTAPPAPAAQAKAPASPDPFTVSGTVAGGLATAPPAAQANAPAAVGTLGTGAAPAAAGGARGGRGGGRGGGGRGIGGQRAAAAAGASPSNPPRFAFDYRLTPEGALRIEPASAGFLTVAVSDRAGTYTMLFRDRAVAAGSVNEIALPPDAVSALMMFGLRASPGENIVHGAMDPPSGTKSDPNPTPNSLLVSEIPVKR